MKIRVDSIPGEGLRIERKIEPSDLEPDVPGHGPAEAFSFIGRARRSRVGGSGEGVTVKGNLTGSVRSQCGRCLGNFKMPVDAGMDIMFLPRSERADDETELVDVDESFSYYDGDSIDLLKEIKDLIIVSLPIKPICREDCKGLCPQCGADLNEGACRCGGKSGPSPFDELKELRSKLEKR